MESFMKKKLLLLIIIPILLAADQATKYWAMNWLQFNGPVDVIDGVFQFRYLTNYGAAWGMFENQILFFLITTILTVALLAFIYFRIPPVKKYIPFRLIVLVIISGANLLLLAILTIPSIPLTVSIDLLSPNIPFLIFFTSLSSK